MAVTYYLALAGIDGDSTDKLHSGWFEVSSFDLGLFNPSSFGGGGGGEVAGEPVFSPLTLLLESATGLAPLLDLAAAGKSLKGATLVGVSAGETPQKVYQLDLGDVRVTRVADNSAPGLFLSLDYRQIELETFVQNDKGLVVPDVGDRHEPRGSIARSPPAVTSSHSCARKATRSICRRSMPTRTGPPATRRSA
jgi:type VI protein secretion system component Hcp